MSSNVFRFLLTTALCLTSGLAAALTLGEARTSSRAGERVVVEIDYSLAPDETLEAGCIHFARPRESGGAAVIQGAVSVRGGAAAAILIRSTQFVETPEIRLAIQVGCGFDLRREYVVRLAAAGLAEAAPVEAPMQPMLRQRSPVGSVAEAIAPRPAPRANASTATPESKLVREPVSPRKHPPAKGDRLVLMPAPGPVGEPVLLLSTELSAGGNEAGERESQRQLLRLEYRLLQALHEQGHAQLDAAAKLRQLDAAASELQRIGLVVGRGEARSEAAAPPPVEPAASASQAAAAANSAPSAGAVAPAEAESANNSGNIKRWLVWAVLVALLLGALGWIFNSVRQARARKSARRVPVPEPYIDPVRDSELGQLDEVPSVPVPFARVEPADGVPVLSDQLARADAVAAAPAAPVAPERPAVAHHPEQMEAQPVMELADIMLSFGRVKGAAQALQEFVDQNPEDALQPWIRLMDVYRMAGMRSEFERVAAELNQHFNVEIQRWESSLAARTAATAQAEAPAPAEPLPIAWHTTARENRSIEDLEHIADRVTAMWPKPECRDYLELLLRDTRGGQRSGFSMPIVEELIFLIELLETLAKMDECMAGK